MFDFIPKHLKVNSKYAAARGIFKSLGIDWKCSQTPSLVFDYITSLLDTINKIHL